jgi:fluoroacetyl-CoA thioesterase
MSESELPSVATSEMVVGPGDLASAIGLSEDDAFPPVFSTSRMIALMEVAGARLLRPALGPGELSVGVAVDITHTAATPVGKRVQATARLTGREGKLFVMEVTARDPGGEIGRGTHKRAIVSTDRLVAVKSVA